MKIAFSQEVQRRWKDELNQYGILYLYAMSGFGKTVQAMEFASREYKEWIRIEMSDHMLEDLEYYRKKKTGRTKALIILDDIQWLKEKEDQQKLLDQLLEMLKNQKTLHCMLLSRARVPQYLTVLKLTRQLATEDYESLVLDGEMTAEIIQESGLVGKRTDLFPKENLTQNYAYEMCRKATCGYAIALNAYIERLREPGTDYQKAYQLALRDVYDYFELHIYQVWDLQHREAMMRIAVCDSFDLELAQVILGEGAEKIVEDMYEIGSFLSKGSDGLFTIHPVFLGFLRYKLAELPDKERSSLYERAGIFYEKERKLIEALECYSHAENYERMGNLICYLSENADGCTFGKICYRYMDELPEEYEERFPRVLAAKAMIYSYHMELEKSNAYLRKLKEKAAEEKSSKAGNEALTNYIRTSLALPHGSAERSFTQLQFFPDYVKKNGIKIRNVIATGNMPSMLNGGLDLLSWTKNYKVRYPLMKHGSEMVLGKEAVGIADVSVGEHLYELNQFPKAIAYLTRGLSEANLRGSIRVQYAATGVMAKVFQADQQWETAYEIMANILQRTRETSYLELIPNIQASLTELELLKGNEEQVKLWLASNPADEHDEFYITERYRLYVKAKAYLSQGRNLEALYILELLQKYTVLFQRPYFQMQLQILRAIAYQRMGEPWKQELLKAAKVSENYQYIRILADQGGALLPLWKELLEDEQTGQALKGKYAALVLKEMKSMAAQYPEYLKLSKKLGGVTKKETEVLRLMGQGMNNQQIAQTLHLSLATVKFHVGNILKKFQADNRTSAVYRAKQEGIL